MGINHKAYPPHPFITMSLIMKAMESGCKIQIPNINVRIKIKYGRTNVNQRLFKKEIKVGYLEIENNNPETIKKKGILKAANQSPKKGTALKPECP